MESHGIEEAGKTLASTAPADGEPRPHHGTLTLIEPEAGWQPLALDELWRHRELIYFLAWRQLKSDYRHMALGPLWLLIRPILSVVLYTVVFSSIAKLPSDGLPFPLFVFSALVLWTFFTATIQTAANSLVSNQQLLGKVYFPRLVFPLVGVVTNLVPLLVSLLVLVVVAAFVGYPPRVTLLVVPLFIALAGLAAFGIGLWLAPWVVRFRDVNQALDYALLCGMYLTPVVYAIEAIPERYRGLAWANPMTVATQGLRWAVFGVGEAPGPLTAVSVAGVLVVVLVGALVFRRSERTIVDVL